jgi:hypothetical protein
MNTEIKGIGSIAISSLPVTVHAPFKVNFFSCS